jgi:hypothetical protein
MPIENLIEVTLDSKKARSEDKEKATNWKNKLELISKTEKYKNLFNLKSKPDTLKGFLIRNNVIENTDSKKNNNQY